MSNTILVRSPTQLLTDDLAGYGWGRINFSTCTTSTELFDRFKNEGINWGRSRKQIIRFFNITQDDIVIVPIPRAIVIGIATGTKSYSADSGHGSNQIGVTFLRDNNGTLLKFPRKQLSQALSSRLKIKMSIASLNEFQQEISNLIKQAQSDGGVCFSSKMHDLQEAKINAFKQTLLNNIRQGQTYLESGGYGLECLVLELLQLEGYKGKINSKRQSSDISDCDIEASRSDTFSSTKLLIQVKHHIGKTGEHGLKQLDAIEDDENSIKWLITTATVSELLLERAKQLDINVMDGEQFIDWLYEHLSALTPISKNKLGISDVPVLLID